MDFGGLGGPGGPQIGLPGPPPGSPGPARNFIFLRGGVGDHSGALPLLRINNINILVLADFGPVSGQSWARDRYQRLRLEK